MIATALSEMIPRMRMAADYGPLSDFWYQPVGSESSSGIAIKPDNAMSVSAVFGCIRLLRESLGSLPFQIYERTGPESREKARKHPLWRVLHDRPNSWQTPMEWKEMGVAHLCLRGNFYCQILGTGERTQLIPLNPDRMEVKQLSNLKLQYRYHKQVGEVQVLSQEGVLHIRGMSMNGITGVSVLEFARNSVGAAIAQETHGASLFKNGGLPTFWISRPSARKWTPQARTNFRAGWRKLHGGADNAGNPPILEDDMEIHELGLTNRDSQWIEARGLSAEEVCRFFGVPPHLIGVKASAPAGNTEQRSLEFVLYTLLPLAVRFEQAADRDLLEDDEDYFTKIALDAQAAADMSSRYSAHNIAVQGGWKTVNEVRAKEDLNPIEGGDTPRYPLNMQPAGGGPDENEQGGQPGKGLPKPKQQQPEQDEEATAYEKRRQRRKQAEAAFAPLLEDAAVRIAGSESGPLIARADKAAGDRGKWNAWAKGIYESHAKRTFTTLDPICASWLAMTGEERDPKIIALLFTSDDLISDVFDTETDIPILLEEWRNTRAAQFSAILKDTFFDAKL